MLFWVTFYECEHDGDAERFIDTIDECGGAVTAFSVDDEEEVGTFSVEVCNSIGFAKALMSHDDRDLLGTIQRRQD